MKTSTRRRKRIDLSHIAEQLRPLAVPVDKLVKDPANVRLHDQRNIDSIKASLKRFGQRKPIVVRKSGMVIEAGNGTLEAALQMRGDDPRWSHLAAVVETDDGVTAASFAIADNRTAELAKWDNDALGQLLASFGKSFDPHSIGFNDDEARELMNRMEAGAGMDDKVPEAPEKPVTKPGDLWELGEHRVLCGDSTNRGAAGGDGFPVRQGRGHLRAVLRHWQHAHRGATHAAPVLRHGDRARILRHHRATVGTADRREGQKDSRASMSKKPPKPEPAAQPPMDDRASLIKSYAMLLYSQDDAALALEMTVEDFEALLQQPQYGDAWENGRLFVRDSLYKDLLAACREGSVPAIKLALELASRNPHVPENATAVPGPLRLTPETFASRFEAEMRKSRHG